MKLLKLTAGLLGLCALGMGAMAQTPETPEAAETPAQTPGNTADATQPDPLREAWLAEARALTNAQIIGEHGTAKGLDLIGVDVVVKGTVNGSISLLKGNLFVLGRVNGSVDIAGGSATILGTVTGPVSVLGGDLRVAGKIKRSADVVGGKLLRARDAVIDGATTVIGGGNIAKVFNNRYPSMLKTLFFSGAALSVQALFCLWWIVAAAFAALVMPVKLETSAGRLAAEPLSAAAVGLLFWLVFGFIVLISILLCLLLIGIPMLGVEALVFLLVRWFGISVVALWFGRLICQRAGWTTPSPFLPITVGVVALSLVRMIPGIGLLVWIIAGLMGAGISILALTQRADTAPRPLPLPSSAA